MVNECYEVEASFFMDTNVTEIHLDNLIYSVKTVEVIAFHVKGLRKKGDPTCPLGPYSYDSGPQKNIAQLWFRRFSFKVGLICAHASGKHTISMF